VERFWEVRWWGVSGGLGFHLDGVVGHVLVVYGAIEVFAEAVVE
jgi:hypothetical protein